MSTFEKLKQTILFFSPLLFTICI